MADEADTTNATNPATTFTLPKVTSVAVTGEVCAIVFDRPLFDEDKAAIVSALNFEKAEEPPAVDVLDYLLLNDSAMRMHLALKLIRHYAMSGLALPGSGMVCDWLKDWIDGNNHGPVGGPLLWPSAIPELPKILLGLGFTRSPQGFVILRRELDAGEVMQ